LPPDTLHNRLVARAVREDDWQTGPWRSAVRRRFREPPWAGDGNEDPELVQDIIDMVLRLRGIPDAWRIRAEGKEAGWGHSVLVLEFLEVEVTHQVPHWKVAEYAALWWLLDATSKFHFRVFRIDRYGLMSPLVTEDTIHELGEYRRMLRGLPGVYEDW
jgi:hypothetical protein